MKHFTTIFAAMALSSIPLFAAPCISTSSIVDGGSITFPSGSSCFAGGTQVANATVNQPFNLGKVNGNRVTGKIEETVFKEAGGTLDFYYQITSCIATVAGGANCGAPGANGDKTSVGTVLKLIVAGFDGVTTDVGIIDSSNFAPLAGINLFNPSTPPSSSDPTKVRRDSIVDPKDPFSNVDALTYTFSLAPGKNSAILLVKTNATDFDALGSAVPSGKFGTGAGFPQNGAFLYSSSFEPIAPTPEPAFYGMMGLGLSGIVLALRRRRSTSVSAL